MADITLGTPITGSIASTDPTIANANNPFNGLPFDEYNIVGLPNFNQVEITVTPDTTLGAGLGAVQVVNAATGAVLTQEDFSGITPRVVTGTSFPGINYKVNVVGAGVGSYKLEMSDSGKASSIVTPLTAVDNGGSQIDVGTIGPNSELFPLASSVKGSTRLFDIALASDNKLYGIGPNSLGQDVLYKIDPGRTFGDQVTPIGTVKDSAGTIFSNTFNALEFRLADELDAIGNKSNKLYTINITTAVATPVIGDLPAGFVSSGDLVADAPKSRFLATSTDTAAGDALWSIPFASPASATKIGNIGFTGVTGLSFENGQLTGFTSGNAAAVGNRIVIDIPTGNGTLQDKIGDGTTPQLTNGIGGASTITAGTSVATNLAPTGITFTNALPSIAKTTSTTTAVKVADLTAIDDGRGTNVFSLTGTDAASFQINGTSLFLKAGTVLNPATKPSFGVTVNVDDAAVGATPDATKVFTLAVTDTTVVNPTTVIGTKGQTANQRTIDLTDYAGTLKADVKTNGDAAYTNNIGFYVVQDAIGTIKLANGTTLKPGDAKYAVEAVKSALLLAGKNDSKLDQNIAGGSIYAPVVVAQGSLAEFVNNNPTNGGGSNQIHAYFNYLGANTDGFDHFRRTGNNTFAVEDQYGGGDKDFNDLVVNLNIKQAAVG